MVDSWPPWPPPLDWRTISPVAALAYVRDQVKFQRRYLERNDRPALKVSDDELRQRIAIANNYLLNPAPMPDSGPWAYIEVVSVLQRALYARDQLSAFDVLNVMRTAITTAEDYEASGETVRTDVVERAAFLQVCARLVVELTERDSDRRLESWEAIIFQKEEWGGQGHKELPS